MAVINNTYSAADNTSLVTFDSLWQYSTGTDANTTILNNKLQLAAWTTVSAFHSNSAEGESTIVLDPSATGTARRIGPAINVTTLEEGQFFYFHDDDGTNYTTVQGHGGSAGWIGTVALAGTYAIADTHTLKITETANDGTDVTFSISINGNDEGSFVALAAPSVAGNDGIYSRRNDNDSPAVIQSFSSGAAGPDVTVPVITLTGGALSVTQGDAYTDPGYSATDNVDGTITGSVVVAGDTVDTATLGAYTITYNVTDAAGNAAAEVTRVVTVALPSFAIDSVPSEIRSGHNSAVMQISNPATVPTVGNTTVRYNGVSGPILPATQVQNLGSGVYVLVYSAGEHSSPPALPYSAAGYTLHVTIDAETDESGLVPFLPRIGYNFIDVTSVGSSDVTATPSLIAGDQIEYELSTGPDAWDVAIDGGLVVTLTGGVNTVEGETFLVRAFDSSDDTWGSFATQTTSLYAEAQPTEAPTIVTTAGTAISQEQYVTFEDPAWTWSDDLVSGQSVSWSGSVNTNIAGVYVRTASATNTFGTSTATYTVTITEAVNAGDPVIVATDGQTLTVSLGDSYADPEWTASDNVSSLSVTWVGFPVNTNVAGVYVRTATSTNDVSTTTLTYTVTVTADTVAPTIELTGSNNISFVVGSSYVEPGYFASDVVDGNVTANVVVSGDTVDPNTAGVYVVLYNVSDVAGNAAVQVSRTVSVTAIPVSVDGLTSVEAIESTIYPGTYAVSLVSGAKAQVYCYPNLHDRETVTLWRSGDGGSSYNIPVLMKGSSGNILLSTGSNTAYVEGPGFFQIRKSDTGTATIIHVDT
jgi:hypothetical protein